jgi:hypothetical protein
MVICPIECIEQDFLEKHSGFVITITGVISGSLGMLFSFFLKSRCTEISCGCIKCNRDVLELNPDQINISTN